MVLDQTPAAVVNASAAWVAHPVDNACLTFPGNLLHGVLPCRGDSKDGPRTGGDQAGGATTVTTNKNNNDDGDNDDRDGDALLESMLNLWQEPSTSETDTPAQHRLTFMVGFWTRRVPDGIKKKEPPHHLYGPCAPLPPMEEATTWVQSLYEGYPQNRDSTDSECRLPLHDSVVNPTVLLLPRITPAWEDISRSSHPDSTSSQPPVLPIPRGMDHRYFVSNAPACFRDSLGERDDPTNEDDPSDEEEDDMARPSSS